ncbi:hypothetical protein GCM10010129_62620 [Streptomyces fumigatiscleroticus]|nr:hypothetical protein GCM10010129_62620 [Streptomyces fumigatiscleroticus]
MYEALEPYEAVEDPRPAGPRPADRHGERAGTGGKAGCAQARRQRRPHPGGDVVPRAAAARRRR